MFDYTRVTSVQIFYGLKDLSGNPFPYALVSVMLLSTILMYAASKFLFGRSNFSISGKASIAAVAKALPTGQAIACTVAFAAVTLIAVLPHIGVVLVAFSGDWYGSVFPSDLTFSNFGEALGNEVTLSSIGNSVKNASLATILAGVTGVAIAYIVVRTRIPGREVLDAMAMLPLAVPGLVLAFGYLAMTREGQTFDFMVFPEAASNANSGFFGIFGRVLGSIFSFFHGRRQSDHHSRGCLRGQAPAVHRALGGGGISANQRESRGSGTQSWSHSVEGHLQSHPSVDHCKYYCRVFVSIFFRHVGGLRLVDSRPATRTLPDHEGYLFALHLSWQWRSARCITRHVGDDLSRHHHCRCWHPSG